MLTLVTLTLFSTTLTAATAKGGGQASRGTNPPATAGGVGARGAHSAGSPIDFQSSFESVTYWQHLAQKRLRLWRADSKHKYRRIVSLLVTVHKLRGYAIYRRRGFDAAQPAHIAGWRCITNGAYPGAPHEGNGVNGPYSGPLGMTNPWMGHSTLTNWTRVPVLEVYAIAEGEFRDTHYSRSWLAHQWPNTYPPCAARF